MTVGTSRAGADARERNPAPTTRPGLHNTLIGGPESRCIDAAYGPSGAIEDTLSMHIAE